MIVLTAQTPFDKVLGSSKPSSSEDTLSSCNNSVESQLVEVEVERPLTWRQSPEKSWQKNRPSKPIAEDMPIASQGDSMGKAHPPPPGDKGPRNRKSFIIAESGSFIMAESGRGEASQCRPPRRLFHLPDELLHKVK